MEAGAVITNVGKNARLGTDAVVTKGVLDYAIVDVVPAKVLRMTLFDTSKEY